MDKAAIQDVGLAAAFNAARILRRYFRNRFRIEKKGAIDLVTEADIASEEAIIDTIRRAFPDHGILAEESGRETGDGRCRWVVDPLDGTTNFAHGIPLFAVSIAYEENGAVRFAIVLNPVDGELFMATAGEGATCCGRRIGVSRRAPLSEALLVTGFPYNLHALLPELMERMKNCLSASRGLRRLGAAALDLCYVADGRFDGFWEQHLKPWDTAAGMLIVAEAGGRITDFDNQPFDMDKTEILATNGRIHDELLTLLRTKETT